MQNFSNGTRRFISSKALFVMVGALLVIDVGLAIIFGLSRSIDIPTFHLDGAYQTASGLYRLADGQWPGKDFYPYLGIGLTYFIYPFFQLAGNDIAASVFAAHFLVACGYFFAIWTIVALLSNSEKFTTGLLISTASLVLTLWLYPNLPGVVLERFTPGNSLRPLRSLLPYIAAVALYLILKSRLKPISAYGLIGFVAGLSLLWSNDFGIPTTGLIIFFAFLWAYRTRVLSFRVAASFILSAVLAVGVGLLVATKGHGIDLLKYNFHDVRIDQYWYFGPWSADSRILTIADIGVKLLPEFGGWSTTLLLLGIFTYFRPSLEYLLLLLIGLSLAGGGALAIIGGHRGGYEAPFVFWSQAILLFGFFALLYKSALHIVRTDRRPGHAKRYIMVPVILVALVVLARVSQEYASAKNTAKSDKNRFFVKELGGYLPTDWRDYVMHARESKKLVVIEEYWGIWSAVARRHDSPSVDSVIHALGNTRSVFANAVKASPEIVITTRYSMAPDWQPWNLSTNYWFYRPLLESYESTVASPNTLIWRKKQLSAMPIVSCSINKKRNEFSLTAAPSGYYEVEIILNHSIMPRSLLLVRNDINFAANAEGYLSLEPSKNTHVFPVVVGNSAVNSFDFKLISKSKDQEQSFVSLVNCSARKIAQNHSEVLPPSIFRADNIAFNLTDSNWSNGVARNFAGLFVVHSLFNEEFIPGLHIKFSNGETRSITRVDVSGNYINIVLDGAPLDGRAVGYPKIFEVIK